MTYEQFTTDNYTDRRGVTWFCVRHDKEGRMVCQGENGHYTVASFATFKIWNWTKTNQPVEALAKGN